MSKTVEVVNLLTGESQIYTCSPKEAVVAAYAQSKQDWNTWEYDNYNHLLQEGKWSVSCGDFCALKGENGD